MTILNPQSQFGRRAREATLSEILYPSLKMKIRILPSELMMLQVLMSRFWFGLAVLYKTYRRFAQKPWP